MVQVSHFPVFLLQRVGPPGDHDDLRARGQADSLKPLGHSHLRPLSPRYHSAHRAIFGPPDARPAASRLPNRFQRAIMTRSFRLFGLGDTRSFRQSVV